MGSRGCWEGWWEGRWAGSSYGYHLHLRFGISSLHGEPWAMQSFSQLHIIEPGHCQEPPSDWCLSMPSTAPAALMKGPKLPWGPPCSWFPRKHLPVTHMETALVPTVRRPSKSTSLFPKIPHYFVFPQNFLLRSSSSDSLCGCSSRTIFGSHPAHTALQGVPGSDRISSVSVPPDPAIPAYCWAEMLPKRTLFLGGKSLLKTKLKSIQLLSLGVLWFSERGSSPFICTCQHQLLERTPINLPLGQGKARPTPLDTDEVAACLKQLGFSSVFFPISY